MGKMRFLMVGGFLGARGTGKRDGDRRSEQHVSGSGCSHTRTLLAMATAYVFTSTQCRRRSHTGKDTRRARLGID